MSDLRNLSTLQLQRAIDSKKLSKEDRLAYLEELNSRTAITGLGSGEMGNRYLKNSTHSVNPIHSKVSLKNMTDEDIQASLDSKKLNNYEKLLYLKELESRKDSSDDLEPTSDAEGPKPNQTFNYICYGILIVLALIVIVNLFKDHFA